MKLVLLLALVACSRPSPAQRAATEPGVELVVGIVDDWTATTATLRSYSRIDGRWQQLDEPWPAVVGRTGVAWGRGQHGAQPGPTKREGDGKSPAGVFALGAAYGYASGAPAGTQLRYVAADAELECVDDIDSAHYNRIVDRRATAVDWTSHEEMRRADALYEWVVEIGHNTTATRGAGSCIFLHVWDGPASTTSGCTAMAKDRLAALLATLRPTARFVLAPRTAYEALRAAHDLPAL